MNQIEPHDAMDRVILESIEKRKDLIRKARDEGRTDDCLNQISELWLLLNRFRNVPFRFYFDPELHEVIKALNPRRYDTSHRIGKKKKYRIAFMIENFSDTGGASVPHRFMIPKYPDQEIEFEQYFIVTNFGNRTEYEHTSSYQYLRDQIRPKEFIHVPPNSSPSEKGRFIEEWILDRDIDYVIGASDPAGLYALASRPAPLIGILSQDCYTFTLGPGFGDVTYMVTTDQVFKYPFHGNVPELQRKVVLLPVHSQEHIDDAVPVSRSQLGVPDDAVLSGTTNLWKCFYGDSDTLISGIARLVRENPNYYHVFAGTPRCVDQLEAFLSRNPDLKDRIRYVGTFSNIYSLLKTVDFWVNSFPTSGGSDLEIALLGKPTIELIADRDLNLHGCEFLRSRECDVFSMEEFHRLGTQFIRNPAYRDDLGRFLREKIIREFNRDRIVKEKIYDFVIEEFERRSKPDASSSVIPLRFAETLDYEKAMAYYSSFGALELSPDAARSYLLQLRERAPEKSFAWIKALEVSITSLDKSGFNELLAQLPQTHETDVRFHVLRSIGYHAFGDSEASRYWATESVKLARDETTPLRWASHLFNELNDQKSASRVLEKLIGRSVAELEVPTLLEKVQRPRLPVYYNY